jgi:hypothetical protein
MFVKKLAEWHGKLCALMDGYEPKDVMMLDYFSKHSQTKLSA